MIKFSSMRKGKYAWYKAEKGNPGTKIRKQHRYSIRMIMLFRYSMTKRSILGDGESNSRRKKSKHHM